MSFPSLKACPSSDLDKDVLKIVDIDIDRLHEIAILPTSSSCSFFRF
tara:strand:+ start:1000 stop:1140 length:141 start_codon:yes stop_codon:yes gene_type:complete